MRAPVMQYCTSKSGVNCPPARIIPGGTRMLLSTFSWPAPGLVDLGLHDARCLGIRVGGSHRGCRPVLSSIPNQSA